MLLLFFPLKVGAVLPLASEISPRLLSNELYTEGWDHYMLFDDGSWLAIQVMISNFGPGDHRSLVIASLRRPDGSHLILKNGRPREKWHWQDDPFEFRLAGHRWRGSHPHYTWRLYKRAGTLEVDIESLAEPWRAIPANTKNQLVHQVVVFLPQLRASARYRLGDATGTWQSLGTGRGFAVKYVNPTDISEVARHWLRIAPVNTADILKPVIMFVQQSDTVHANHLALFENGRPVKTWRNVSVEYHNESVTGAVHPLPVQVQLRVESEHGGVSGKIRLKALLEGFNFVDELKPWERFFVRFIDTPIHYRFLVEYDLEYHNTNGRQQLHGEAIAEWMTLSRGHK